MREATVRYVHSGDRLTLSDGTTVALRGVWAPRLAREDRPDQPFARAARSGLSALIRDRPVRLDYDARAEDPYGRVFADIHTLDGDAPDLSVQRELLRLGLAYVRSRGAFDPELLTIEAQARAANRGLWSDPEFAVRDTNPDDRAQEVDSYRIVEGVVLAAETRGRRTFLNFGTDYRTDFTVVIAGDVRKRMTTQGTDPDGLAGARVRVRGWMELSGGPSIWLATPELLEILD